MAKEEESVAKQKDLLTCDQCDRDFATPSSLETHQRVHTGEKPYGCDLCGRGFARKSALKCHLLIHTGEKPFVCDTCGKGFAQRHNLLQHSLAHTGAKPFACDICGETFKVRYSRERHMLTHSDVRPTYVCKFCDKALSSRDSLNKHRRLHKEEDLFECDVCGKKFCDVWRMRRHREQHEFERKPLVCYTCDCAFSNDNELREHFEMHAGLKGESSELKKQFTCEKCGRNFVQKGSLTMHQRWHV